MKVKFSFSFGFSGVYLRFIHFTPILNFLYTTKTNVYTPIFLEKGHFLKDLVLNFT